MSTCASFSCANAAPPASMLATANAIVARFMISLLGVSWFAGYRQSARQGQLYCARSLVETGFDGKVASAADGPPSRSQRCRSADGLETRVLAASRRFFAGNLGSPALAAPTHQRAARRRT